MKTKVLNIGNNPFKDSFVSFVNKESLKWQLLNKKSKSYLSKCAGTNSIVSSGFTGDISTKVFPTEIPYSGGTVYVKYGGKFVINYENGYQFSEDVYFVEEIKISGRTDSGEIKYSPIPLDGQFEGEENSGLIYWDGVQQLAKGRPSFSIDMEESYADKTPIKLNTIRENLEEKDIIWEIKEATTPIEGTLDYIINDEYELSLKNHFIGYVMFIADAEDCEEQTHIAYINCKEDVIDPNSHQYSIENLITPKIIDWNETSTTIEYDQVDRYSYYSGKKYTATTHVTIKTEEYFGKEFDENTTSSPIKYYGKTESWEGVSPKDWEVIQNRNEKGIANISYTIEIGDNNKHVDWNSESTDIHYTGCTYITYYDDSKIEQCYPSTFHMEYPINSGLTEVHIVSAITFPEIEEGYAQENVTVIQDAGAKNVKDIRYEIIDVDDKKYVEYDVKSVYVPFTVKTTKILNDNTTVTSETLHNWYYEFDENQTSDKIDRPSTIIYPNDGGKNNAQEYCVTYQYGAWQILDGSEKYEVKVTNHPEIDYNVLSADIQEELICNFVYHNGKNGSTKQSVTETVNKYLDGETEKDFTQNNDQETRTLTGYTKTDWHDKNAIWYVDQKAGGVIIKTEYKITNVVDSNSNPTIYANYNDTFYDVSYDGVKTEYYKNGTSKETPYNGLKWTISFSKNGGNKVEERTDTIKWNDATKGCMIRQHGAKEESGNYHYVISDITPYDTDPNNPQYNYNDNNITISYTGETYVIYLDGTIATEPKSSESLTKIESIEPDNNTNAPVKRSGTITWNGATKDWQCYKKGGKTVTATTYFIENIFPQKETADYLPYNATSVNVLYTGVTTYHYEDGTTSYNTTNKEENPSITPHNAEDSTERDTREGEVTWPNSANKVTENNTWSQYIHGAKEFITGDGASHSAYTDNVQDVNVNYDVETAPLEFDFHVMRLCYDGTYRIDDEKEKHFRTSDNILTENFGSNTEGTDRDIEGITAHTFDIQGETYNDVDIIWKGKQKYNPYKKISYATCEAYQIGDIPTAKYSAKSYQGLTCQAKITYVYEEGDSIDKYEDFTINVSWDEPNDRDKEITVTGTKLEAIDLSKFPKNYPNIETYTEEHGGCKPSVVWELKQNGAWQVITGDGANSRSEIITEPVIADYDETSKRLEFVYNHYELCYIGEGDTELTKQNSKVTTIDSQNLSDVQKPLVEFATNTGHATEREIGSGKDIVSKTFNFEDLTNQPWSGTQGADPNAVVVSIDFIATQSDYKENESPKIEWNVKEATIPFKVQGQYKYKSGNYSESFDLSGNYSINVNDYDDLEENDTDETKTYTGSRNNAFDVQNDERIKAYKYLSGVDWYPNVTWTLYQWGAQEFLDGGEMKYSVDPSSFDFNAKYDEASSALSFNYITKQQCHNTELFREKERESTSHTVTFDVNYSSKPKTTGGTFDYKEVKDIKWTVHQPFNPKYKIKSISGYATQINVEENVNPLVGWDDTSVVIDYTPSVQYTYEDNHTKPQNFTSTSTMYTFSESNTSDTIETKNGIINEVFDLETYKDSIESYDEAKITCQKPNLDLVFYQHGEWEINENAEHVYGVTSDFVNDNQKEVEWNVKTIKLKFVRHEYKVTYGGHLVDFTSKTITDVEQSVDEVNNGYEKIYYEEKNYIDKQSVEGTYKIKDKSGNIENINLTNKVPWQIIQKPNNSKLIDDKTLQVKAEQIEIPDVKSDTIDVVINYKLTFTFKTLNADNVEISYDTENSKTIVKVNDADSDEWKDVTDNLTMTGTTKVTNYWSSGEIKSKTILYEITFPKVRNLTEQIIKNDVYLAVEVKLLEGDIQFFYQGEKMYEYNSAVFSADYEYNYDTIKFSSNVTAFTASISSGKDTLETVKCSSENNNLKTISNNVFKGCTALTSIALSDNITSIGTSAFEGCSKLTTINDTNTLSTASTFTTVNNSTFKGCSSLQKIIIPNNVTTIGDSAFSGCSKLCSISFNEGLTTIGKNAFSDCFSDTSCSTSEENTGIVIPNSVISIGSGVCSGCTYIKSVTIGTSLTIIPQYAFYKCSPSGSESKIDKVEHWRNYARTYYNSISNNSNNLLKYVVIPNNITTIENNAFELCQSLSNIEIGTGVTTINKEAFKNCYSNDSVVTTLVIPNNVNTIGESVFENCLSLKDVTYNSNANIPKLCFSNCNSLSGVTFNTSLSVINEYAFYYCISLMSFNIPESVYKIGNDVFYKCSLNKINIPKTVNSIGEDVFSFCNLENGITVDKENKEYTSKSGDKEVNAIMNTDLTILYYGNYKTETPNTIETIYYSAFKGKNYYTSSFTSIPNSVTNINIDAFAYCSGNTDIQLTGTSLTTIDDNAFSNIIFTGKTVKMSNSVKTIGSQAFCHSDIYEVFFDFSKSKLTSIGSYAFSQSTITSFPVGCLNLQKINEYAFYYCINLTSQVWYECSKLTNINEGAFSYCTSLKTIDLTVGGEKNEKEEVINTTIGKKAFYNCEKNKTISIGEYVTLINEEAFSCNPSVTSITVSKDNIKYENYSDKDGKTFACVTKTEDKNVVFGCSLQKDNITIGIEVTSINNYAFEGNIKNTNVTLNINNNGNIGTAAFSACTSITSATINNNGDIGTAAFSACTSITSATINNNGDIGTSAFTNCDKLTSVEIGNKVTSIGQESFEKCSSITSITLGNSVSEIKNYAFYGCSSLTSITIPSSVTSIGNYAFQYCSSLMEIICNSTTPPTIKSNTFFGVNRGTKTNKNQIKVPDENSKIEYNKKWGVGDYYPLKAINYYWEVFEQ